MGRGRSRNQPPLPMEKPVPVKLTDEERDAKAHQMAVKRHAYRAVKRELKRTTRAAKEEMEVLEREMDEIADALITDQELRRQGDLRFEGKIEATAALAQVEQKAPLPSEPHAYLSPKPAGGEPGDNLPCTLCGSGEADPIHPVPRHEFVGDGTGEGRCRACPRPKDDEVHGAASAPVEPVKIECSRCGKATRKEDGLVYDREVKPVCDPCHRAAIEAGTWPHPFRAGHEKAKRCADCMLAKDDAVHDVPVTEEASVVDTDTTPGDTPPAESVAIAREHVTGDGSGQALPELDPVNPERVSDPAFDFPADEPPPNIIRTHAAIERHEELEEVGGEG